MPRAIVLPVLAGGSRGRGDTNDEETPLYGAIASSAPDSDTDVPADDYGARLSKYIPVEALAGLLLATTIGTASDVRTAVVAVAGLVGAVLWALTRNNKLKPTQRQPSVMIILFTGLAFAGWTLGVSPEVRSLLGVNKVLGVTSLIVIAFLLPTVDNYIASLAVARAQNRDAR